MVALVSTQRAHLFADVLHYLYSLMMESTVKVCELSMEDEYTFVKTSYIVHD